MIVPVSSTKKVDLSEGSSSESSMSAHFSAAAGAVGDGEREGERAVQREMRCPSLTSKSAHWRACWHSRELVACAGAGAGASCDVWQSLSIMPICLVSKLDKNPTKSHSFRRMGIGTGIGEGVVPGGVDDEGGDDVVVGDGVVVGVVATVSRDNSSNNTDLCSRRKKERVWVCFPALRRSSRRDSWKKRI